MSSTKDYKDYILEQLHLVDMVDCKPMMGEFLLYSKGKLFGGIYDNQLLIKRTINNAIFKLSEVVPYKNAKPMYLIDDIDDDQKIAEIVLITCKDLNNGLKND